MADIACGLHYPQQQAMVHLAAIDPAEWQALAAWVSPRRTDHPMLARVLMAQLPVVLDRPRLLKLHEECQSVDWDALDGVALACFASLSLFIDQAATQEGAGVRFEAEP